MNDLICNLDLLVYSTSSGMVDVRPFGDHLPKGARPVGVIADGKLGVPANADAISPVIATTRDALVVFATCLVSGDNLRLTEIETAQAVIEENGNLPSGKQLVSARILDKLIACVPNYVLQELVANHRSDLNLTALDMAQLAQIPVLDLLASLLTQFTQLDLACVTSVFELLPTWATTFGRAILPGELQQAWLDARFELAASHEVNRIRQQVSGRVGRR